MIHIIIPVFNRWGYTQACIESLRLQTFKDFKIIIVDHGSTDGTATKISIEFPEVILLKGSETMWWAGATNLGINYSLKNHADYMLTLNNDVLVQPDYLQKLVEITQTDSKALLSSLSLDKNITGEILFAGVVWNRWNAKYKSAIKGHPRLDEIEKKFPLIKSDLLPGRGTLIPKEAFQKCGLYDEFNFPHYAADEDFSLRCKKQGFQLLVVSSAIVFIQDNQVVYKKNKSTFSFHYLKNRFFSERSPVNLKRRWRWARKQSPIPFIYFLCDIFRILGSQIKNG